MTWLEHLKMATALDKAARRHMVRYIESGYTDTTESDAHDALSAEARRHRNIANRVYGKITKCLNELEDK